MPIVARLTLPVYERPAACDDFYVRMMMMMMKHRLEAAAKLPSPAKTGLETGFVGRIAYCADYGCLGACFSWPTSSRSENSIDELRATGAGAEALRQFHRLKLMATRSGRFRVQNLRTRPLTAAHCDQSRKAAIRSSRAPIVRRVGQHFDPIPGDCAHAGDQRTGKCPAIPDRARRARRKTPRIGSDRAAGFRSSSYRTCNAASRLDCVLP